MSSFRFTLYVAGRTSRSITAITNLRRLGEAHLSGQYELRVVDVVEDPDAAERERILTTPTLIKEEPAPVRRVTGDLSDGRKVLLGLAIDPDLDFDPFAPELNG
jgi:circadian clock protein KaiB